MTSPDLDSLLPRLQQLRAELGSLKDRMANVERIVTISSSWSRPRYTFFNAFTFST